MNTSPNTTFKSKAASAVQRLLLRMLALSARRGLRVEGKEFGALMADLMKNQPELAHVLATGLKNAGPQHAVNMLKGIAGDPGQAADADDIDSLINFSAYWRDDWVAAKAAEIPAGARVLDAGAGQCRYKNLFRHTRYESQDFAQYQGSEEGPLQETWNYGAIDYVCDITDIPVETGSFDVVLCTEVLEHVPNPIMALKELVRVTAPGGRLLISAPLGSGVHQEPYHFYGGFSAYFYEKFFDEFGCDVVETKPLGGLMRHVAQEVHRAGRSLNEQSRGATPEQLYVLTEWLPRMLSKAEDQCFVEQFTVGYLVEARKRLNA